MPCVSARQMSWLSTRHMSCVSALTRGHSQHKGNRKGGGRRPKAAPPLWRWPKAASFVLAVNTGHILVLRPETCALLRAKTCAVLSWDMYFVQNQYKVAVFIYFRRFVLRARIQRSMICSTFSSAHRTPVSSESAFWICLTFCSARGSPRILESQMLEISDVLFWQRSPIILESTFFEIPDVLFCAQESQHS